MIIAVASNFLRLLSGISNLYATLLFKSVYLFWVLKEASHLSLMRSFNSAKGGLLKFSYLAILSLALFGLIAPLPSHASLSGPFGEVQLSMYQINTRNVNPRVPYSYAYGAVSIGGSWYYVNNSAVVSKTTTSNSSTTGGGVSATNTSASASASASASSSSTTVTATTSSEINAPLKLVGSVTFFYLGGSNKTVPMEFTKSEYYVGELANFTTGDVRANLLYYSYSVVPESLNGTPIGPVLTGLNGQQGIALIDLYNTIVALPQFNDYMLDAYATAPTHEFYCFPQTPNTFI